MDIFNKISPERLQEMLNAGFLCFGRDGYQKAAMSEIAAQAGISKALLFHYFGTKKKLYEYLYQYACNEIIREMTEGSEDFFDCIRLGTQIKLRVMMKHPGMYDFLLSLVSETSDQIEHLKGLNFEAVNQALTLLFARVDWTRFRQEYDRASIMELVSWISDGCIRQYSSTKSGDEIAAILDQHMLTIKRVLYKEEYV